MVHGLSIPLGKLGYLAPRTLSRVVSESLSDDVRGRANPRSISLIGGCLPRRSQSGAQSREIGQTDGPTDIGVPRLNRTVAPSRITESGTSTPRRDREIRFPDET